MRGLSSLPLARIRRNLGLPALLLTLASPASGATLTVQVRTAPADLQKPATAMPAASDKAGGSRAAERWVQLVIPRGDRVQGVEARVLRQEPYSLPASAPDPAAGPLAVVTGVGAWYGYQIAFVRLHPLVRDAAGTVLATEIELALRTEPGGDPPLARQRDDAALGARERAAVRAGVANPEQVDAFAPPAGQAVVKRGGFRPAAYPDLEGSDVQYVIVTSAALAPAFQVLADWKTRRGVPAVVRTIESIQANTRHGSDLQETIRTFLQDAYSKWSLSWVLLGGDTDLIPARYLSSSFGSTTPELIPCDLYFAGLDGNWNQDGDALWGEAPATEGQPDPDAADLLAEVYLARAPVVTPAQAATFVRKAIDYETPLDPTYQANTLFLGEVLFPTNWDTSQAITMDGGQMSEDLIARRFPPGAPVQRRYEDYAQFPGSLPLTRALSLADLQMGFNLVNHIGHGFRYNMSVGDQSIVNSDVDALTNVGRGSILNILNCTSLAFDYACLGEHFLLNPVGGAAAVIGASRSAYPLPAYEYQDDFYDLLLNQNVWRLGELFARSRLNQTPPASLESAHRYTHYIYNVLGEPEMAVFDTLPAALTVLHPASADLGANSLEIEVQGPGAVPVAGARICLQKGIEDYRVGSTGVDGRVTLSFTAESPGNIDLTVSGRNLRTHLDSIGVAAAPATSYVHVQSTSVDDDAVGGTSGNGDGVLDAGETVDVALTLRNDGGLEAPATSGSVAVADAYVSVLNGSFTSPGVPAGGSAATTPVRLRFTAGCPDQHAFEMQFTLLAGGDTTHDRLRREIHAPVLRLVRLEVLDGTTGNGNGEPDEGEVFDLRAWVKNYGSGRVDGLNGTLQTSNPNLTILRGSGAYGSIASMTEGAESPLFQLSEDILDRNFIDLRLTDSRGRLVVHRFELRRPAAPPSIELDPTTGSSVVIATWPPVGDTDLAGYNVYRSGSATGPWTRATADYTNRVAYFRDTGLATSTRYYYSITAVDSSGNESVRSPVGSISTNPPQIAGWPIAMSAETSSSPALGDLDGDGLVEIVQGDDHVYAWHGNGEEILDADNNAQTWGVFSVATGTTTAAVVLAELDGTPGLEVFACNWNDNGVFALDGDGRLLWTACPVNGSPPGYWGSPMAADVDRDGRTELFAASKDGHVYAWKRDGTPFLAGHPDGSFATIAAWSRSSPAVGDLDADFALEIVVTDVAGNLWAWNADGSSLPGFPKAFGMAFYNSPVLGDVDGDGELEIVAISQSGSSNLHCLRGQGTELAGFPITVAQKSASLSPTPALADLDGDGKLEILVGSNDYVPAYSRLYVYRWNGSLYPGWPQPTFLDSESSPVVADFDGDGHPDIVFGGQDGMLRGWRRDGTELVGFPLSVGDFIRGTPAVGDVDGDGGLDLVLAGWDRNLYVWDIPTPYDPALAQWPAFLHDAQRTAQFGFQVHDATDAGATASLPRRLELLQNLPNPFNPTTEIRFGLPTGSDRVRLDIYDVRGRLVRALVDAALTAGRHRVAWDGRDARGRGVAAGVYFYRLRCNGAEEARRMLLLQ